MKKMQKISFMGAGRMARVMADTVTKMKDTVELYAVAARDSGRAADFAQKYGAGKWYGSYEELLSDPQAGLIYISTPHSHHAEHMLMCMEHGKNVLCEKTFTLNAEQAERVFRRSKEKGLLVAEAIWPRYMPLCNTLAALNGDPRIGDIMAVHGNLGYPVYEKPRIGDLALGGGALLDVGIYAVNFAVLLLGYDVERIHVTTVKSETGADVQDMIILRYADGRFASLYCSVLNPTDRQGIIYGSKGYAVVENINLYDCIRFYNPDHQLIDTIKETPSISGYEYEVSAALNAASEGKIECSEATHAHSLKTMQLMDRLRKEMRLVFPSE